MRGFLSLDDLYFPYVVCLFALIATAAEERLFLSLDASVELNLFSLSSWTRYVIARKSISQRRLPYKRKGPRSPPSPLYETSSIDSIQLSS